MSTGVAILGSTGSIGKTTLAVIRNMPGIFHVVGLAAGHRVGELEEQIREFSPEIVSVAAEADAIGLRETFPRLEVLHGMHGAVMVADTPGADTVVAAIVGSDGLAPTYRAVERGKRVALANKESLVMAGRLVMETARRTGAELLPVDSEHCAIFQCMRGENPGHVRRIILTASGGALRDQPIDGLEEASIEKVLAHPTWSMGRKITVDSATMVNKGFEIIEAHYLFDVPLDRISVLVHREGIVHSMVEFVDGSLLAQMAETNMILPVQYALTYPARMNGPMPRLDLAHLAVLSFSKPDERRYPCLSLSRQAAETSEAHMIALNAANEEAVAAFLERRVSFSAIFKVIGTTLEAELPSSPSTMGEVLAIHQDARRRARKHIEEIGRGS